MTCDVKIIEDSINTTNGVRLTTFELRYWRSIHGELMTHRAFSRNASSSRAIPISTFLKQVWNDPASPIHWGANNAGMQSEKELTGIKKYCAKKLWNITGKVVCGLVWFANVTLKPHKQTFNRLLEPWQYISVIVTASDYDNFFELRCHPDAQPEIQELATMMRDALASSIPVKRRYHLPYIESEYKLTRDGSLMNIDLLLKLSTARCARVSYLTHDGKKPSQANDLKLYEQLVGSVPMHASPSEHQAIAQESDDYIRNFRGWKQHRVIIEGNLKKDAE